jgi:negative regulator of sigma E activity
MSVGTVPINPVAPAPPAPSPFAGLGRTIVTTASVCLVAVVVLGGGFLAVAAGWRHLNPPAPGPSPAPTLPFDAAKLGQSFAPVTSANDADGWDAAADRLEQGGTMADAQAAKQDVSKASRVKAFNAIVAPDFSRVIPVGSEPKDAAQRAEVVAMFRQFANGLRGKAK